MAFQPISFLGAKTVGSPLLESLSQALQQRHAEQMQAPQRAADLAKTQAQTGLYGAQAKNFADQVAERKIKLAMQKAILSQIFPGYGAQPSAGTPPSSQSTQTGDSAFVPYSRENINKLTNSLSASGVPTQQDGTQSPDDTGIKNALMQSLAGGQPGGAQQAQSPGQPADNFIRTAAPYGGGMSIADRLARHPMQASIVKAMLGDLGKNMKLGVTEQVKQSPETGQVEITRKYPSGKTETQVVNIGKSPGQVSFEKESGKNRAGYQKTANDAVMTSQPLVDDATELLDATGSDVFRNTVGPWNSRVTKVLGTDRSRQLLGRINAASGSILLNAAGNLKGSFTGREASIINNVKPNANDTADVFMGKLITYKKMLDLSQKRNDLISKYLEPKYKLTSREAIQRARNETPLGDAYDWTKKENQKFSSEEHWRAWANQMPYDKRVKYQKYLMNQRKKRAAGEISLVNQGESVPFNIGGQ